MYSVQKCVLSWKCDRSHHGWTKIYQLSVYCRVQSTVEVDKVYKADGHDHYHWLLTRKVLYWLVRTFMNALGSRVNADHPHILDYRSIRCGSIPWYLWLRGIFHSGSDRDLVRFSPDSSGRNKDPELREPCHYTEYTRYLNARSIVSTDYGRLVLSIPAEYTLPIELCSAMLDEHEQCVH